MSNLLAAAVFGLEVPAGDVLIPAETDFPSAFRITMAAIDPTVLPEYGSTINGDAPPRATLKLVRVNPSLDDDDSEINSEEEDSLAALINGAASEEDDDEESSDDEMANGGPSNSSKGKQGQKAREDAAVAQLKKALAENDSDSEMMTSSGTVSKKLDKGKAKAIGSVDDSDDSEDIEDEYEEFVLCTLDPAQNYQQPLDITVNDGEQVFFKVSGTHTIYLTGNYVVSPDSHDHHHDEMYDDEDEEEDYDLSPDEDELDKIDDPRITEVGSEDDEPPKLIKAEKASKKGKNKRAAEDSGDEPAGLDDIMAKILKPEEPKANGEPKLSKKQLKKLKNNAGNAVEAAVENKNLKVEPASTESPSSKDKKVQFTKKLEQGPSGKAAETKVQTNGDKKTDSKKENDKPKAALGPKTVQGVKIDDKKLGTGPAAKKGDKVGMRYIGKLTDGKVFDANKKGKPFNFKLGTGEVIKGWDIGVAGMSVGGERRIVVPANLAYGSKSMPGIPANSQLTFDMKLLEIQ